MTFYVTQQLLNHSTLAEVTEEKACLHCALHRGALQTKSAMASGTTAPHVVRPWTEMETQRVEEGQLAPCVFVKDDVWTEGH